MKTARSAFRITKGRCNIGQRFRNACRHSMCCAVKQWRTSRRINCHALWLNLLCILNAPRCLYRIPITGPSLSDRRMPEVTEESHSTRGAFCSILRHILPILHVNCHPRKRGNIATQREDFSSPAACLAAIPIRAFGQECAFVI